MKNKFDTLFPTFKLSGDSVYVLRIDMDEEVARKLSTEEALKMSRMKFEKALELIENEDENKEFYPEFGINSCPLCAKFWKYDEYGPSCDGCPIKEFTGKNGCVDTPYDSEVDKAGDVGEYKVAIANEIAFLKSMEH